MPELGDGLWVMVDRRGALGEIAPYPPNSRPNGREYRGAGFLTLSAK